VRNVWQRLTAANANSHLLLRKVVGSHRESHLPSLARAEMDALEAAEIADRSFFSRAAADV
jgi:hypothetical protein